MPGALPGMILAKAPGRKVNRYAAYKYAKKKLLRLCGFARHF